jgi:hypothetical protein
MNVYERLAKLTGKEQQDRDLLTTVREKIADVLQEARKCGIAKDNKILIPGTYGFEGMYWQIAEEPEGGMVLIFEPGQLWLDAQKAVKGDLYGGMVYRLPADNFYDAMITRHDANHGSGEVLTYRSNKVAFMKVLKDLDKTGIGLMTNSFYAMKVG